MSDLKHSHVIVHRHRKRVADEYREKLEAHKKKGPLFAAAVEALLGDLAEAERALAPSK